MRLGVKATALRSRDRVSRSHPHQALMSACFEGKPDRAKIGLCHESFFNIRLEKSDS